MERIAYKKAFLMSRIGLPGFILFDMNFFQSVSSVSFHIALFYLTKSVPRKKH